jgi:hypothetical protein
MRFPALFIFFILSLALNATPRVKAWKELSRPEKMWTLFHPHKAKIVYRCAQRARFVTDSLEKAGALTDSNGGQLDAFRHAYWCGLMMQYLPERVVRRVGENHERGNYIDFRKGKLEEGERSDSIASVMDLRNNEAGISIALSEAERKNVSLIQIVINNIWNGKLCILKKDAEGNYLDKDDKLITLNEYKNKWYIPKCIVSSDQIIVKH